MKKPLVSIIVPNYNHSDFLVQRLDSIFNQTFTNFEVILLDDCSRDNSREILSKYAKNLKVSHCIFNEVNSGNTFNQWIKGISLSKGEYIWIAESDDYCSLNFLEDLLPPLLKEKEVVLSYCQSNRVNENGKVTGTWLNHTEDLDKKLFMSNFMFDGNEFIKKFLIYKNVIPNASGVVFRKEEVTNKIEYLKITTTLPYCGDWVFYMLLLVNKRINFTPKTLNYFRYHSQSVIASMSNSKKFDSYQKIELNARNVMRKSIKFLQPINYRGILVKNYKIEKKIKYDAALNYIKRGDKIKGVLLLVSVFDLACERKEFKKIFKMILKRS